MQQSYRQCRLCKGFSHVHREYDESEKICLHGAKRKHHTNIFHFSARAFQSFFVVEKVVAANGNLLKQFSSATFSGNYPSCSMEQCESGNMQATFDKKLPSSPFAVRSLVERWKSEGEKLKR